MGFFSNLYFGGGLNVTGAATQIADAESVYVRVGASKIVTATCNQDIDELTLAVVIEAADKTDLATISHNSITRDGTSVTFEIPSSVTTLERRLRGVVSRTDTSEPVRELDIYVTYQAAED